MFMRCYVYCLLSKMQTTVQIQLEMVEELMELTALLLPVLPQDLILSVSVILSALAGEACVIKNAHLLYPSVIFR